MLCAALLLTAMTATDERSPVAVVVASKRSGADTFSSKVAAKVRAALAEKKPLDDASTLKLLKKAGGADPRSCMGATPCLIKAAQQLGPQAVLIGIDVGKIGKNLAIHIEAVAADASEPLAVTDIAATADNYEAQSTEPLAAFIKQLTEKLAPAERVAEKPPEEIKRPADAPTESNLTPPPSPTPVTATAKPSRGPRILPIATVAAAGAALIASAAFLILGMSERGIVQGSLTADGTLSNLTQPEFNRHRSLGNTYFTVSLSTAIVGVVLGAAAGVLFAMN